MYNSPARTRVEREAARRRNAPVVISTLLSLVVVAAAVAVVAWLVLRTPSDAVDSAERLEPVGTAIPAPTEIPALPTVVSTQIPGPEPTALGFTGDAPAAVELPTVAAPVVDESGPTPTPRVIALPTVAPTEVPPPPPTLPPSVPVAEVPVVALAPVEVAPPPAQSTQAQTVSEPLPQPTVVDNDPFNIFQDEGPQIAPAQNEALERVRAMQDDARQGDSRSLDNPASDSPDSAAPTPAVSNTIVPVDGKRDNPAIAAVPDMPDVDAMIEDITARATNPDRNPNVKDGDRPAVDRDNDGRPDPTATPASGKKKTARKTPTPTNRSGRGNDKNKDTDAPAIQPGGPGNQNDECRNPFSNLPEDMQPKDFPFNDCPD